MKNISLNHNNFGRDLLSVLNGINKKQFSNAHVIICRKAESAKFTDITDKGLNCIGFRNVNVNGSKLILSDGGGPVNLNDFLEDIQDVGVEKLSNLKELALSSAPECRYTSVKYLPSRNILALIFDVSEDSNKQKSKFGGFLGESSKIYTKKQLIEAISYWRKQLTKGNYRKVNESIESEGIRNDIEAELAARNDIPNYLKAFIHDEVLEDAGHDGVGWHDWDLDGFVQDLLEDRIVEVDNMIWNDGNDDDSTVTRLNGLPLKFTFFNAKEVLQKMFPNRTELFPSGLSIKFPSYGLAFYWADGGCFDDSQWREEIAAEDMTPIELDSRGDASSLYDSYSHRIYTIGIDGVVH